MLDKRQDQETLRQLAAEFKARRRRPPEPRPMAELMSQLLSRKGYAQQQSLAEQEDAWAAVVGPQLSGQSRPGLVRRGVLEVFVAHSTVLQELTFRKRELLEKLAARLPAAKLRDLKFKVGPMAR